MELAQYIDHTLLKPDSNYNDIARLCREARQYGFAAVCVNPCDVKLASELLADCGVGVCSVIDFPLGKSTPAVVAFEAKEAIGNGATELDFVLNTGAMKAAAAQGADSRQYKALEQEWEALNTMVHSHGKSIVTKLIIECCYLKDEEKVLACRMAKAAGFDFVKTSTGFGPGGATTADVKLMRETVGATMGVKAAGGIRTREDALEMIAAGATRIGCSRGVEIVRHGAS